MGENACRHFKGLYPDARPACARGWDVRKWARKMNGGSDFGIALRLPCTKQHGEKPLWDCPNLDRKTDSERAAEKAATQKAMNELFDLMPKFQSIKEQLQEQEESGDHFDCLWCKSEKSMSISISSYNGHMHVGCEACGKGFIE